MTDRVRAKWTPQVSATQQAKDYRTKFKYNLLFRLFFCWVDPLFCLGSKRSLEFNDLYAHPSEADSNYLLNKFNKYWLMELQRKERGQSPRLFIAWLKCFWWKVILHGVLISFNVACMITLSELLGSLVDYFVIESPTPDNTKMALLFAMGITLSALGNMFFHAHHFHQGFLTGFYTKIMFTGLIYKKTLQLSQATVGKLSVGHIVNLASNDVHKFDEAFARYHFIWIGPLHVMVVTYLLYIEVQWSAFVATALLVFQIPLHLTVLKFFSKLRFKAARMADRRIKVMNEVISGIRVIKMYAWEYAFKDIVATIRRTELFIVLKYFLCLSVSHTYKTALNAMIMFLTFAVYVSTTGNELVPRKVFVTLSLITFVRFTSVRLFIMATHNVADARVAWIRIRDIDLLPEGDLTLVGERGVTLSGGQRARVNLARAVYCQADVYLLDDPLSAVDPAVSKHLFDKCICGLLSDKCVILVTHQTQYLKQCDAVLALKEGKVVMYDTPTSIIRKSNDNQLLCHAHDTNEAMSSETRERHFNEADTISSDALLSEKQQDQSCSKSSVVQKPALSEEERAHGSLSMKTYIHYFIAGGGYIFTPIVVAIFILTQVNIVSADWWIADWADCNSENLNQSTCLLDDNQRIGISGAFVVSLIIIGALRVILYFILLLNAAKVVHNNMFAKVLRAPILFFDTNPIGRVLNRFSKDISFLDDRLLYSSIDYLDILVQFLATIITASVANPYILIAAVALFVSSLALRWYYLKTARDIKRLEALALSPMYSHLSLTIRGLSTIRTYSMEDEAMNQFHEFQNQHTQAAYLYIVTSRWFGMRIDTISAIFIAIVSFVSIPLSSTLNASLVGLALTYAISLSGSFQYCVRQSAEFEGLMISAERVMAYGRLESEAPLKQT
ncbi:PREDICTED: multidrug resistance-associated protein 4-like, partial [Amphimedon queenslandica]|uniref:ABC transmembrane type-1 domain-containing protein n=1 Tax=Amphimedon queenslandica TaxID=400682 RepID=A0AAN0J7L6_AMPQE